MINPAGTRDLRPVERMLFECVTEGPDLTICAYTAQPGTRSAEALALLGNLAATAAGEKPSPAP
jgi:hypothetical protein